MLLPTKEHPTHKHHRVIPKILFAKESRLDYNYCKGCALFITTPAPLALNSSFVCQVSF